MNGRRHPSDHHGNGLEMTSPLPSRKSNGNRPLHYSLNNDPAMVHNPLFASKRVEHAPQTVNGFKVLVIAFLLFVCIPVGAVLFAFVNFPEIFLNFLDVQFMSFFTILFAWSGIFHFGVFLLTLPSEIIEERDLKRKKRYHIALQVFALFLFALVLISWFSGFKDEKSVVTSETLSTKPKYDFGSCTFGWKDTLSPTICGSPATLAKITPLQIGDKAPTPTLFVELIDTIGEFIETELETFLPFLFTDDTLKGGETCARFINAHIICNVLVQPCSETCEIDQNLDHAICKAINTKAFGTACAPANRYALATRTRLVLKDLMPMVTSVLSTSVTASLKKKNIFSESNKQLIIEYITVTLQMYETMDSDLTRPGGLYCQNLTAFVYNNTVRENKNYNCSATEYDRVMRELASYQQGKERTARVKTYLMANVVVTILVLSIVCLYAAFATPCTYGPTNSGKDDSGARYRQGAAAVQQEMLALSAKIKLSACLVTETVLMVGVLLKVAAFEREEVLVISKASFNIYAALFNMFSLVVVTMIGYHCQHGWRILFYGKKEKGEVEASPKGGEGTESRTGGKKTPLQYIAWVYDKYSELTDMNTGPYFFTDAIVSEVIEVTTQIITFDALSKQNDVIYVQLATLIISANLVLTPLCLWHRHKNPQTTRHMLPVLQNTLDLLYLVLNFVYLSPGNVSNLPILYAVLSPSYWLFDALKDYCEGISVAKTRLPGTEEDLGIAKALTRTFSARSSFQSISARSIMKLSSKKKTIEGAVVIVMVSMGFTLTGWITFQTISINLQCASLLSPAIWEGSHPRYVFSDGPFFSATCALHLIQTVRAPNRGLKSLTSHIGQLANLTVIDLQNNELTALPTSIIKLRLLKPGLSGLNLKGNPVWKTLAWENSGLSTFPKILYEHMTEIVTLRMPRNNITEIPARIVAMKNLQSLDLESNSIRSLPGEISQLDKLTMLNCMNNPVASHFSWSAKKSFPDVERGLRILKMMLEDDGGTLSQLDWSNNGHDRVQSDCRHCKDRTRGKFLCTHHIEALVGFTHVKKVNISGQCLATFTRAAFNTSAHWQMLTMLDISNNPIYNFEPDLMVDITRDILSAPRSGTLVCHDLKSKSALFAGVQKFFPWEILMSMKNELEYFGADKSFGLHESPSFKTLCHLTKLKSIFLTYTEPPTGVQNRTYTKVPRCWFSSFSGLEVFMGKVTGLKGRFPPLFQLPKMNIFDLQDTPDNSVLTVPFEKVFLPISLAHFSIQDICAHNIFNRSTIHAFSHLTSLALVDFIGCAAREFPNVDLKPLENLEKLKISKVYAGGIPHSFRVLTKLQHFEWSDPLYKSGTSVEIPSFIGNFTGLKRLVLRAFQYTTVRAQMGPWITKLSKLEDARLVREALNKSLCHSFPLLPSLRKLNLKLNLEESDILWIVKLQQIKTLDLRGSTFNNYNKTTSGFNFTFILESLPELSTFHFDLMNNPQYGFSASDITQLRNAFPNKLLCLKSNSRECDDGLAYQKGQ